MISFDGLRMAAYVVLTVAGLAVGWGVRGWKEGYDAGIRLEAKQEADELVRGLVAGISKETLEAIGNIRIENRTIYQKATHEVQTNTVYRDCRVPAAGVQLINDARTGTD
jgi:hypothetical protein